MNKKKVQVIVGKLIRVCPGKKHAWYESNVGPVRKEIKNVPQQKVGNGEGTTEMK